MRSKCYLTSSLVYKLQVTSKQPEVCHFVLKQARLLNDIGEAVWSYAKTSRIGSENLILVSALPLTDCITFNLLHILSFHFLTCKISPKYYLTCLLIPSLVLMIGMSVMGWIVSSQNSYVEALLLLPQHVNVFGDKAFKRDIKLK